MSDDREHGRRLEDLERLRLLARKLARAAADDPLALADTLVVLWGEANRWASDGACTPGAWVERQLAMGELIVGSVAAWTQVPWPEVLRGLGDRLEMEDFVNAVRDDIGRLP
jgi:hypothetical protein